jgi:hypothetical protein
VYFYLSEKSVAKWGLTLFVKNHLVNKPYKLSKNKWWITFSNVLMAFLPKTPQGRGGGGTDYA